MNYKHNKVATFLFNYCEKGAKFLYKHKWLYYLLAFTWGLLMSVVGLIISGALICIDSIPHKRNNTWFFKLGERWGGVTLGCMFIMDTTSSEARVVKHEEGHTYQNALLGPFFIFLVAIPSFIRYK